MVPFVCFLLLLIESGKKSELVKEETAVDNGTMMQLIVRKISLAAGTLGVQLKSINKQLIKPLLTRS